jgi:ribose transport system permease protein
MTNQTPEQMELIDVDVEAPLGLRSGAMRLLGSWRTLGIAIPFVILFVVLSIASQPFLHTSNLINILDQQAATLCIAAAGTLVLVAGGIDLSVGATYGLATVIAGEIAAHHSPLLAIGAALIAGLVVGLVNGLIVTVFKINALITTLAMSFVVGGIALRVSSGNLIVLQATGGFYKFANAQFLTIPSAVWMTLVFFVILGLLLSRTTFGRYMVASGGNAEAARLAGVRVNRIKVLTFTLSGGAAALGGVIDVSRLLSAQAAGGGTTLAFTVLAGIVVGGTSIAGGEGSVWRTGIGVLFIALIGNGFNLLDVNPLYQQIVLGIILLFAVGLDSWARLRRR